MAEHEGGSEHSRFTESIVSGLGHRTFLRRSNGFVGKYLARLFNVAPRKNIILFTFGMPRVGNYDYALQHDQLVNNSWKVVNDNDLVPHFPTVLSVSILNGPYHHGVEAFYSQEAISACSANGHLQV